MSRTGISSAPTQTFKVSMISRAQVSINFPLLARVRVIGLYCLNAEMPHVLFAINTMLDNFSAGKTAQDIYKCTGSLSLLQYVAARESIEDLDPIYRRAYVNDTVEITATVGDLKAVKWLVESYKPKEYLTRTVSAAATNGHIHILQWLLDNHRETGYWGATEMCGALLHKQVEVVEWLRTHCVPHKDSMKKVVEAAAAAGNVEIVAWLFKDCHVSVDDALWSAQTNKQWGMARWILENSGIVKPWVDWDLPAKDGALSFLKFLRSSSIGGPGLHTLQVAAWNGHLDIVVWLYHELRVPFSSAVWHAADYGHSNVIKWFHDNGYQHSGTTVMNSTAMNGQLDMIKWLHEHCAEACSVQAMDGAALEGHLHVVQWLHENRREGCTNAAMNGAASKGYLEIVTWLHEHRREGCTHVAMDSAAGSGHLNVVQWLQENRSEGCSSAAMDAAASNGHLEMVKWLHKKRREGCTTTALDMAAENGYLEVVKWLHEHRNEGCSTNAMDKSAANGHLAVVKYLHENREEGCTFAAMTQAILGGHFDIVLYLESHRSEGFRLHRNSIIRLPLELMQWVVAHYADSLHGCEFEVERSDWGFNEWCRRAKLRMVHQNNQSVWWECSSKTIYLGSY